MKKYIYSFALLLLGTLFIISCKQEQVGDLDTHFDTHLERAAEKVYPVLGRFIEKNYPDDTPNIEAFVEAKELIQNQIHANQKSSGFDDEWLTQGPGNIGARINTLAVHPTDQNIIYVGYGEGGVYKTTDGGTNWESIFDDQTFLAIGDIVIDETDPNIVYVGTGDPSLSGFPHVGNGMFKSSDGGETWENIGLEAQRVISKIEIDPTDPNTIYVASLGLPFTYNDSRGLFKTTDGGKSWEKIFYISDSTGIVDVVINPENPDIVITCGWDRVRSNSVNLVSGDGADFYMSQDAGASWNKIISNLPDTVQSRTGLTICKNYPNNVYAVVVDAERSLEGIYRSTDYGMNFNPVPLDSLYELTDDPYSGFGWYFGRIRVNPNNPDNIFVMGVDLYATFDGGLNWERAAPRWWTYQVHADKHDMVITDDENIFLATDGGLYKSTLSNLEEWEDLENIPTTQFYKVAYSPFEPDKYYGGAQDNGTTSGNKDDINNWQRVYGGDGFQTVFSSIDPAHFYCETQNGNLVFTTDFGASFSSGDRRLDGDADWDMPYLMSPQNPTVMFAGTDQIYINLDSYDPRWAAYSPKLTTDQLVGGGTANITTLSASVLETDLLYAGTNDGQVWVGEDSLSFRLISNDLPLRYVTSVAASPNFVDHAFVSFSGYKDNDNTPRLHKTTDRGNTWTSIIGDLPNIAINNVLVIPGEGDLLLFVATDAGVYGTQDGGSTWSRMGVNMPNIIVMDLKFNPATNEVIAGTYGKSIMTYDISSFLNPSSVETTLAKAIKINILPNPTQDFLNVDFKDLIFKSKVLVTITDYNGRILFNTTQDELAPLEIDVSNYTAGTYLLGLETEDHREVRKWVKI